MFESLQGEKRIMPAALCAFRSELTDDDKRIYDAMCRAVSRRERSVSISGVRMNDFTGIARALRRDQPFFYYLKQEGMKASVGIFRITLSWEFLFSDADIERYDRKIEKKLRSLKLPKGGSVLRREIYLHDMMQKIGLRAGSSEWEDHCIIGPLLMGHTVCEGMALLFYLLCVMCDVPCRCIVGRGTSHGTEENHAWNLVKIGSEYAHIDVFWDALIRVEQFKGYCYDYLNLSDKHIKQDHSWDESKYPVCRGEKYSFFALQKADVHSFAEYRALVRRCREKGKFTITARMHYGYEVGQCVAEIMKVYRDVPCMSVSHRINEQQNIFEVRVNKKK